MRNIWAMRWKGIRDRFVIATKVHGDEPKEAMAADIEKSLQNLRTDHIESVPGA